MISMPKKRLHFERALLVAFDMGMVSGYAVEHTDCANQEHKARLQFMEESGFRYSLEELRPYLKGK